MTRWSEIKRRMLNAAAAAVLCFAGGLTLAPSASAEATGAGEVGRFKLELIDLDPLDGVAPSFGVLDTFPYNSYWEMVLVVTDPVLGEEWKVSHWSPEGTELTWGVGRAGGRVGGIFDAGDPAIAFASVSPGGSVVAWSGFSGVYSLTPNTEVVLTIQASLSGAIDIGRQEEAAVVTGLIGWNPAGERLDSAEMAKVVSSMPGRETPWTTFDRNGDLSIRFANPTSNAWVGTFSAFTRIDVVSVVPEPSHWALFLAGIIALAVRQKALAPQRRSRRQLTGCRP